MTSRTRPSCECAGAAVDAVARLASRQTMRHSHVRVLMGRKKEQAELKALAAKGKCLAVLQKYRR